MLRLHKTKKISRATEEVFELPSKVICEVITSAIACSPQNPVCISETQSYFAHGLQLYGHSEPCLKTSVNVNAERISSICYLLYLIYFSPIETYVSNINNV